MHLPATRLTHEAGVMAGRTGAAGIGGLLALNASSDSARTALGVAGAKSILTICTEGISDGSALDGASAQRSV